MPGLKSIDTLLNTFAVSKKNCKTVVPPLNMDDTTVYDIIISYHQIPHYHQKGIDIGRLPSYILNAFFYFCL